MVGTEQLATRSSYAESLHKIQLRTELLVDLDNIANGVFSPLNGFMGKESVDCVTDDMKLPDGSPWTIPVPLTVSEHDWMNVEAGVDYALTDAGGVNIYGIINIDSKYVLDLEHIAKKVFKTRSVEHYGVKRLFEWGKYALGGSIEMIRRYTDEYSQYLLTPVETKAIFLNRKWKSIVAFQTRNIPHIGHEWLQKTALSTVDGLFIHPLVGDKKKGDYKDHVVIKSYQILTENYYPKDSVLLSPFRTMMRYAGPREAIFHALIRKNFGCTHFIVGRDHAGVGNFYGPYEAQEMFSNFPDLGITPVFFKEFSWCKRCNSIVTDKICPHRGDDRLVIKGTWVRDMLVNNNDPPSELIRKEVIEYLRNEKDVFI
jgi:sulfate adenylyltransferase